MEQPVLGLGLLGFSDAVAGQLQLWAAQAPEGWPAWRVCDPHLADAWMINGGAVEVQGRDEVRICHPLGSEERFSLNRIEVDRPLAFSTPLPEGFASAEFFDAASEASVRQRLQRFEAWLRPLRAQFALGSLLVERLPEYRAAGVVHLTLGGKQLAVIDLARWQVGLLVPARPVDVCEAEWTHGPALSTEIPSSFIRLPLHRVLWAYAVRTRRDVLPAHYREQRLYLRRVPRLPAHWFGEHHLVLMRELMARPSSFSQLQSRTGCPEPELTQHLGALYHAGGLTTNADSARRAELETRSAMVALQFDQVHRRDKETAGRQDPFDVTLPSSLLHDSVHSPLRPVSAKAPPAEPPE